MKQRVSQSWRVSALAALGTVLILTASPPTVADGVPSGKEIYSRCQACHSLQTNSVGPKLCGVVGRQAGTLPGFNYSSAMLSADFVWSRAALMRFLENPMATVKGTRMGYAGIKNEDERHALVNFLVEAAQDARLCP
ncbi:c-type cytochrome [Tepidicaulis sp. LMO-SS28]|uniref:c-type cytochrome n=1 Tax=Tepidicaulis sp. LMO-SS28 TaxID=3447455 RepID=UPI003EE2D9E1